MMPFHNFPESPDEYGDRTKETVRAVASCGATLDLAPAGKRLCAASSFVPAVKVSKTNQEP